MRIYIICVYYCCLKVQVHILQLYTHNLHSSKQRTNNKKTNKYTLIHEQFFAYLFWGEKMEKKLLYNLKIAKVFYFGLQFFQFDAFERLKLHILLVCIISMAINNSANCFIHRCFLRREILTNETTTATKN